MTGIRSLKGVGLLAAAVILFQCTKEEVEAPAKENTAPTTVQTDSAKVAPAPQPEVIPAEKIEYSKIIVPAKGKARDSVLNAFKSQFSEQEQYDILALNRLDKKNIWHADTLVIPKKFEGDFLAYSPFPTQLPVAADVDKLVLFSYPIQAYAVYEQGKLLKWGPSSMGKKSAQTKRGLMFTNWKKELAISTVKSEWKLPYNFNIHNTLGIGWHQYDLPGYPASHSCLRLLEADAKWLYAFADQWILNKGGATTKAKGTPVIVFGDYAWGKAKPWKSLDTNPDATNISVDELTGIIEPLKEEILKEQENRKQVLAGETAKKQDTLASR